MSDRFQRFLTAVDAQDDDVTEAIALTLRAQDEPALISLLSQDGDEERDPERRWWSIRALALCGGPAAVPTLAAVLEDGDGSLRAAAAMALASVHERHPAAVAPTLGQVAQLLNDEDGAVRQVATDSLARCGDDAIDALAAVLEGNRQSARTRAMAALRKIATVPAARLMFQYLNDDNYLVHTYAYEGLDEMGLLENVLLLP